MTAIIKNGVEIGKESDSEWPGYGSDGDDACLVSAIVISHSVEIYPQYRGQGFGNEAHEARLQRWVVCGHNYALCTVRRDNVAQLKILQKNGWVRLANTAANSGVPIYIMGRNLK